MLGFRVSIGNIIAAAALFVVSVWVLTGLYGPWWAWVVFVLTLLVSLSCIVTIRGATVWEWVYRRLTSKKKITLSDIVAVDSKAVVWHKNGASMCMYIEIFGSPWEVSQVAPNTDLKCPTIPLKPLSDLLRQFGITLNHIRVVNYGYKTATEDNASVAVSGVIGTLPYMLGGRTFLEVSVKMEENWNAIYARMPHERDKVSDGLTRSVSIATDRILRVFENYDIPAKVMNPADVTSVTNGILGSLASPLRHPEWRFVGVPGDGGIGAAVTFTPQSFSATSRRVMGEVVSRRQFYCTTLSTGDGVDRVNQSVTYLVDGIGALELLTGQGLRRDNGHHTARISHLVPLGNDIPVDSDGVPATPSTLESIHIPTHGLGIYLGQDPSRSKLFVHPSRGAEALWIIGNDTLARRLALRASTLDLKVATCLNTDDWYNLVTKRKSRSLILEDIPSNALFSTDIMFCTPDQYVSLGGQHDADAASVIVVSDAFPPITPHAYVVAHETDPDMAVIVQGNNIYDFVLDAPPNERSWIEQG